ncbi:HAD-IA family hydrolase [Actinomycetospora endophytica]|uniref:HAD-IA family hydrolase n=1 Tax=Actinomycetospora endophytica TaxID=2291215 RepID=A0ABS8PCA8_9PSEU|nr:HAD-IA family hydrolase [Actinomycetospora endophytica]MCD2195628.1 HAD-IA family hydrolase [Actinomycetospora endophytica]
MSTPRALLLDIGGVLLTSAHERMGVLGDRRPGLGSFTEIRGLLGPRPDVAWDEVLAGRASERGYWAARAAEYAALVDDRSSRGVPALMDVLYPEDEDPGLFRPEVVALMDDAHAAGLVVAALTNDLAAFHGDGDLTDHPVLGRFDTIVDGSVTGVLKPEPGAYRIALDAVGCAAGEVVFLDDIPGNCAGGRAAGLVTVEVDVRDPAASVADARNALGLGPPETSGKTRSGRPVSGSRR